MCTSRGERMQLEGEECETLRRNVLGFFVDVFSVGLRLWT
jgi:hypothetical protein